MTREEASNILWWASKRHYPGDQMDITAEDIEAFDIAIAALREPLYDWPRWAKNDSNQITLLSTLGVKSNR